MNVSRAEELLIEAGAKKSRLRRHLLVAAALREVLGEEPIVVGGTAQEFYTRLDYHETDLDLVGWLSKEEEALLIRLGFERMGRHWFHEPSKVAVEFPGGRLAGEASRVHRRKLGKGTVALIGVDDLYLDRIRQATASPRESSTEFRSAVAVGLAASELIDWRYVDRHLRATRQSDPPLGKAMNRIDSAVRKRIRESLAT